jgi:hypothetical protein
MFRESFDLVAVNVIRYAQGEHIYDRAFTDFASADYLWVVGGEAITDLKRYCVRDLEPVDQVLNSTTYMLTHSVLRFSFRAMGESFELGDPEFGNMSPVITNEGARDAFYEFAKELTDLALPRLASGPYVDAVTFLTLWRYESDSYYTDEDGKDLEENWELVRVVAMQQIAQVRSHHAPGGACLPRRSD